MALIEIRSASGERLAAADDVSDAIKQLVTLCGRYRAIVEEHNRQFADMVVLQPDTSATAPEHVAVFSSGWNACLRAVIHMTPR